MIRYPKEFKPAIKKYNNHSDPSIWLKMYNIAACASRGIEDHMAGYFSLVMGKAPLLWLDNLPAECITSWATLSAALHHQLSSDLQSPWQYTSPRQSANEARRNSL
jgi:hypothetical protein